MYKKILFAFLLFIGLQTHAQSTNPNEILIEKVKNFYSWYKTNYTKLDNFILYKGNGEYDDPPYKINWKAVEQYFAYIRKNVPALGEAFITWHRNDFKRIDEDFKLYPTEEIPIGFDYERIVGGQVGVEEVVDYAFPKNGKWKLTINGNTAMVICTFETLDYETNKMVEATSKTELKKENGIWKIARTIGMVEADNFFEEEKKYSSTTI
jgi:hypothetical protein